MSTATASDITSVFFDRTSPRDPRQSYLFAGFAAVSWYNAIELVVLCFVSFKRRGGVYFWSLLLASIAVVPHGLGYFLLFFSKTNRFICVSLISFSWYFMVSGQSIVLWSRLHLVLQNQKVLRGILYMIIINFFVVQVPNTVFLFGTAVAPGPSVYSVAYNIFERVQLVAYLLQEVIISTAYVVETVRMLRLRPQGRPSGILRQLLAINVLILLLDVAVVAMEFTGYYSVQVMFKPVAYSIKLKLEYAILGKLVLVARGPSISGYDYELPSTPHDVDSFPSPQGTSHFVEVHRDTNKSSIPWFGDPSRQPSRTSSAR